MSLLPVLRDAIKDEALSATSFRTLLVLVETLDLEEERAIKHDWLAQQLGLRTAKSVRRALSQLARRGYVDRTPRKPGAARLYTLNYSRRTVR